MCWQASFFFFDSLCWVTMTPGFQNELIDFLSVRQFLPLHYAQNRKRKWTCIHRTCKKDSYISHKVHLSDGYSRIDLDVHHHPEEKVVFSTPVMGLIFEYIGMPATAAFTKKYGTHWIPDVDYQMMSLFDISKLVNSYYEEEASLTDIHQIKKWVIRCKYLFHRGAWETLVNLVPLEKWLKKWVQTMIKGWVVRNDAPGMAAFLDFLWVERKGVFTEMEFDLVFCIQEVSKEIRRQEIKCKAKAKKNTKMKNPVLAQSQENFFMETLMTHCQQAKVIAEIDKPHLGQKVRNTVQQLNRIESFHWESAQSKGKQRN